MTNGNTQALARRTAEKAARQSYGKLIAFLSARTRDVPSAEDALAEALVAALRVWPERGVPDNPDAWLLVTARRLMARTLRHDKVVIAAQPAIGMAIEEASQHLIERSQADFPDERLKLMFVCTHPAIDSACHAPLILQTVLGLDAKRIASAFLVSPLAMGQRLVRAKTKIREAGIPFSIPAHEELAARLGGVLQAIYAAYALGWNGLGADDGRPADLADEAVWLARMLLSIMPTQPEVMGLLSLMLYSEARKAARLDETQSYIPLDLQDTGTWNAALMIEADTLLQAAGRYNAFGVFQCEAAIQSVHAERRYTGQTNWPALGLLYEALVRMKPTLGARVAQAAVVSRTQDAAGGLALLDRLNIQDCRSYQPYWAVRAHVLSVEQRHVEAMAAYATAIGLSESESVRRFLQQRQKALSRSTPTGQAPNDE